MSTIFALDIRYPIGVLFSALGLLLGGYGVATNADVARYAALDGLNVNLWWGVVMLAFGMFFLLLARRGDRTPTVHSALETPEGRAIEASEKRRGLEGPT